MTDIKLKCIGLVQVDGSSVSKLKDFTALQNQIQQINVKGVQMADYKPSNVPEDCPAVNATWQSGEKLPPTPNNNACSCMAKAAQCVVASSTDASDYGKIFDYICGSDQSLCDGINGNTSTGVYGGYSMCGDQDKLTYVLNQYYQKQNKDSTACDFNSSAQTQTASGTMDKCNELVASSNSTSSGSGSGSSSGDGKDNGALDAPIPGSWLLGLLLLATIVSTNMMS